MWNYSLIIGNNYEVIGRSVYARSQTANNVGQLPDQDCLFNPALPKCSADPISECPEGFVMNANE